MATSHMLFGSLNTLSNYPNYAKPYFSNQMDNYSNSYNHRHTFMIDSSYNNNVHNYHNNNAPFHHKKVPSLLTSLPSASSTSGSLSLESIIIYNKLDLNPLLSLSPPTSEWTSQRIGRSLLIDSNTTDSSLLLSTSSSPASPSEIWNPSILSPLDIGDLTGLSSNMSQEYRYECQNSSLTNACNLRYSLSWTVVLFVAYLIVFFIGLLGNLSVLWIVYGLKGEHHGRRRHSCVTSNMVGTGGYGPNGTTNHTLSHSFVSQQQQSVTTVIVQGNGIHYQSSSNQASVKFSNTNNPKHQIYRQQSTSQHYQPVGTNKSIPKTAQPLSPPIIYINRSNIVFYRFVSNLAVADLLVLLFCLPPTLIGNIYLPWILGRFVCKAVPYLQGVSVNASVYTLVAISIDRFYAIYYPLSKKCSTRLCWITIALIWGMSFAISLPWLIFFEIVEVGDNLGEILYMCRDIWPSTRLEKGYFLVVNLGLQYLIPLSVIAFFYILILKKIAHRKLPKLARHLPSNVADGNRQASLVIERSKVKVFKMLIVLVLLFALSWLPLYMMFFLIKIGPKFEDSSFANHLVESTVPVAQWLGASNSCVNPILYFFFNAKFRAYYRDSWLKTFSRCMWLCPVRRSKSVPRSATPGSMNNNSLINNNIQASKDSQNHDLNGQTVEIHQTQPSLPPTIDSTIIATAPQRSFPTISGLTSVTGTSSCPAPTGTVSVSGNVFSASMNLSSSVGTDMINNSVTAV